jgi:hypothetical protein
MTHNENTTPQGGTSYHATQTGNGAIAQGNGAQAIGAGGVVVGGNSGNVNTGTQHFSGGTVVFGGVDTGGGDFIGRDKIIHGTPVADFAPLLAVIAQASAPADKQAKAMQQVATLQAEVAKGKQADDTVIAAMLESVVALIPATVNTLVGMFSNPLLGEIAGGATKYVLKKLSDMAR